MTNSGTHKRTLRSKEPGVGVPLQHTRVTAAVQRADPMSKIAREYVRLVLAMGQHDTDYVDAYYGPDDIKREAESAKLTLDAIGAGVKSLEAQVAATPPSGDETRAAAPSVPREAALRDERPRADAQGTAPVLRRGVQGALRRGRARLSRLALPGRARSASRSASREPDRSSSATTPGGARSSSRARSSTRSSRRRSAPAASARAGTSRCRADEHFTVEYVTNKSWSGYNWYQGNFRSLIQVNTDLPIYIDRAIDLACHEGYPGHHVYNALLEQHLVQGTRLARVHGLSAVLAAVADRRRHGELRDRGRVPGAGADRLRARHAVSAGRSEPARARPSTTT